VRILVRGAAGLALLIASPILIAAIIAIWLEDGSPVLFRQTRIGQYGKPFSILKLRSMRKKAAGNLITMEGDARITRVGRLLRKFKLDELPQLWNVLRGEMNIIGPRPEVPLYVDAADPVWQQVLCLKPGLTDLATLVFRDEERTLARSTDIQKTYREVVLPEKLALNLNYARARSVVSDLKLIALTARYSLMPGSFNPDRLTNRLLGSPPDHSDRFASREVPRG
jgi:lipopolysaccharide/colanic/teichoic acid biosynthesis glycosyltransferase